jgi:hypothetical protein
VKGGNPVVMLDRRRLAAPLFAQAGAFVVVLIIGGFTGHSSSGSAASTTTPAASPSIPGEASATVPTGAGQGSKLTVRVEGTAATGTVLAGTKVNVLQSSTLASAATGTLNAHLEFAVTVPAGSYQVCLSPATGTGTAIQGNSIVAGWVCRPVQVGAGPKQVLFPLAPGTGT